MNSFSIEAVCIPQIPLPQMIFITLKPDDQQKLQLDQTSLPTKYAEPDIIIGLDNMRKLRLSQEDDLPSGYSLFSSTLGPIIYGHNPKVETGPDGIITAVILAS